MVRWEPGAKGRLQHAALQLFADQGFEQTTTAQIARSVGLTERTFFRHFTDKREVLFYGQQEFFQAFIDGVQAAPDDAAPVQLIVAALESAAEFFPDDRRAQSRTRQAVIDDNAALRERELHKLSALTTALAEALRDRGLTEPAATLTARSTATVFEIAFTQWLRDGETRSLVAISATVLTSLQGVTAAVTNH